MICIKIDSYKIISIFLFLILFELLFINFPKCFEKPIYLDIYNINFIPTQKTYLNIFQGTTYKSIQTHKKEYTENYSRILEALDIYPLNTIKTLINYQYLQTDDNITKINVSSLLIIQVHNRPQNVRALITSLQESQNISNVLIVFSSDCYSPETDEIIQTMNFAPYIYIKYPLSQEVFQDSFKEKVVNYVNAHSDLLFPQGSTHDPQILNRAEQLLGQWISSCEAYEPRARAKLDDFVARSSNRPQLLSSSTASAPTPATPKFGLNLLKHHWWWKLNAVFGSGPGAVTFQIPGLNLTYRTADFEGPVVLIEEDHYVMPDAFHVLNLAWAGLNPASNPTHGPGAGLKFAKEWGPASAESHNSSGLHMVVAEPEMAFHQPVRLLSLGNYEPIIKELEGEKGSRKKNSLSIPKVGEMMDQARWRSAYHNMGIVLDRRLWKLTFGRVGASEGQWAKAFCNYDDYNWDWTLNRLLLTLIGPGVYAVYPKIPRVVHIGVCGVHQKVNSNQAGSSNVTECSPSFIVDRIKAWVAEQKAKNILFPAGLKFTHRSFSFDLGPVNPNGGWASAQDHELCLNTSVLVGGLKV